jgi:hypothetical protein
MILISTISTASLYACMYACMYAQPLPQPLLETQTLSMPRESLGTARCTSSTTDVQRPSQHRYILRVTCHCEYRHNTAGVALKSALRSQVCSPRSVGLFTLSTDEHCENTALRLHATRKIAFELTDHLSDSRHHGGDPLPTCAPSHRP